MVLRFMPFSYSHFEISDRSTLRLATLPDFLLQRIDRDLTVPVNRQIYQVVREAILSQVLPVGMKLPSSRDLANELNMSRNTVMHAYEQLIAEGYLETRSGSGTFIADTVPDQIANAAKNSPVSSSGKEKSMLSERGAKLIRHAGVCELQWGAFMPGVPDVTMFPNKIWARLQNKVWRRSRAHLLTYDNGGGYMPLREAIAEYLRAARSVNCTAEQVMITTGIHQSIDLVAKLLGENGNKAWVENPCYWGTRSVLQSQGIEPVPIQVDQEGMQLLAPDLRNPPRFIFVTPSHQYPLGVVMSLSRRRMLLEYAAANDAWIIEDDYDSEFRYGSRPLASLQGMDTHDRVLYMGTFSKTMFPGLRIGFLVVPEGLSKAFATGLSELYRGGQISTQAVLTDFIKEGYFTSYIRRMRVVYAERLRLLTEAIKGNFGDAIIITGSDAGLHLALKLPDGCEDYLISEQAMKAGIIARPLSRYYMNPETAVHGLLLGYGCVPDEEIGPAFDKLAKIIKASIRKNI